MKYTKLVSSEGSLALPFASYSMKEPTQRPVSEIEGEGRPQSAAYQLEDPVDHREVGNTILWILKLEMGYFS